MYFKNRGITPSSIEESAVEDDFSLDPLNEDNSDISASQGILDEDAMLEAAIVQEVEMMHDD